MSVWRFVQNPTYCTLRVKHATARPHLFVVICGRVLPHPHDAVEFSPARKPLHSDRSYSESIRSTTATMKIKCRSLSSGVYSLQRLVRSMTVDALTKSFKYKLAVRTRDEESMIVTFYPACTQTPQCLLNEELTRRLPRTCAQQYLQ
ncbi:uncharacterized protein PHALS_15130 [Plasmopara halstedii]|uniref:Uncharacterized protein n=1 Tax=Plasmopara halstedii TaxID=4781 RepID=A0A0P1ABU6_PLAHL|nr:uncharacterized protein PHALS_15130 [Plasmopara halstedii]CEG37928.1 hypothetical protein PHALS_15130 [Plasmopara halstedii]|eukprot:XP_024574297.1 hypothetical protein PHALS_15130 [Plasmopara halstedii]